MTKAIGIQLCLNQFNNTNELFTTLAEYLIMNGELSEVTQLAQQLISLLNVVYINLSNHLNVISEKNSASNKITRNAEQAMHAIDASIKIFNFSFSHDNIEAFTSSVRGRVISSLSCLYVVNNADSSFSKNKGNLITNNLHQLLNSMSAANTNSYVTRKLEIIKNKLSSPVTVFLNNFFDENDHKLAIQEADMILTYGKDIDKLELELMNLVDTPVIIRLEQLKNECFQLSHLIGKTILPFVKLALEIKSKRAVIKVNDDRVDINVINTLYNCYNNVVSSHQPMEKGKKINILPVDNIESKLATQLLNNLNVEPANNTIGNNSLTPIKFISALNSIYIAIQVGVITGYSSDAKDALFKKKLTPFLTNINIGELDAKYNIDNDLWLDIDLFVAICKDWFVRDKELRALDSSSIQSEQQKKISDLKASISKLKIEKQKLCEKVSSFEKLKQYMTEIIQIELKTKVNIVL